MVDGRRAADRPRAKLGAVPSGVGAHGSVRFETRLSGHARAYARVAAALGRFRIDRASLEMTYR